MKTLVICFLFILSWFNVFAQELSTFTIQSSEDKKPLEGAILIIQPLQKGGKSQALFTDKNGTAHGMVKVVSVLSVQLAGYKTLADTIRPNQSCTFSLLRDNVNLNEVVITGQYNINTTDKSLYSVEVLDQKTIESKGATSLDQLLTNELNIRLAEDNILGSSVSINGLSGQNVKILIDGVPMIGRENGNIDLSQINLNDIERVEIIKGPMSVIYGTDAIGGLINLITKKNSKYRFEGNLNLKYETVGIYNIDGSVAFRKNNHHFTLSGGRYFFGGFNVPDTGRAQQWKPWEQYFASAEYGLRTKWIDWEFRTDVFHQLTQSKGVPVITPYQAYAFDDYYTTNRLDFTLLNNIRLPNTGVIQLTNAYSLYERVDNTYLKNLVDLSQSLVDGAGNQDTSWYSAYVFRGTYSISPQKWFSFQTGYDINLQSGSGFDLLNGHQYIDDYAAFGSMQFNLSKLQIRPGLRLTYNTRYGAPVIPSLNLKYDVNDDVQLRASYSRGFRAPALQELDLDFVDVNHNIHGNPDLKAEHSDNYIFSIDYLHHLDTKQRIKFNFNVFYNNITNIITLALLDTATNYYTYINIQKYQTVGSSVEAQWLSTHFTFQTGFSLTGLYNSLAESDPADVQKISYTPEFTVGGTLHSPKLKMDFSLYVKNTGTTPGFALNAQGQVYQTTINPFTMFDIIIQKHFLNGRINLSGGVKNLLNVINIPTNGPTGGVHSINDGYLPYATGRSFFLKINYKIFKS